MTDLAHAGTFGTTVSDDVIDVEVLGVEDVHREDGGTRTREPAPASRGEPAAELAAVIRERDEFLDMLQRTKADFANYRSRTLREQAAERAHAVATVIDRLLPALDALDGARAHHPGVIEPVDAVLHPALVGLGVERIEPMGEPFDPGAHDAVAANDDEVDGTGLVVAEVLRPGYRCRGRLVRPAMVRVGSAKE